MQVRDLPVRGDECFLCPHRRPPRVRPEQDIERGELERVLPEFGLGTGGVHVVFPTRRGMVPAVRALIDALAEGFRNPGPTLVY